MRRMGVSFLYLKTAVSYYIIKNKNFYKKIYRIIGTTLTIIGLMLIPFLSLFISGIPMIP